MAVGKSELWVGIGFLAGLASAMYLFLRPAALPTVPTGALAGDLDGFALGNLKPGYYPNGLPRRCMSR